MAKKKNPNNSNSPLNILIRNKRETLLMWFSEETVKEKIRTIKEFYKNCIKEYNELSLLKKFNITIDEYTKALNEYIECINTNSIEIQKLKNGFYQLLLEELIQKLKRKYNNTNKLTELLNNSQPINTKDEFNEILTNLQGIIKIIENRLMEEEKQKKEAELLDVFNEINKKYNLEIDAGSIKYINIEGKITAIRKFLAFFQNCKLSQDDEDLRIAIQRIIECENQTYGSIYDEYRKKVLRANTPQSLSPVPKTPLSAETLIIKNKLRKLNNYYHLSPKASTVNELGSAIKEKLYEIFQIHTDRIYKIKNVVQGCINDYVECYIKSLFEMNTGTELTISEMQEKIEEAVKEKNEEEYKNIPHVRQKKLSKELMELIVKENLELIESFKEYIKNNNVREKDLEIILNFLEIIYTPDCNSSKLDQLCNIINEIKRIINLKKIENDNKGKYAFPIISEDAFEEMRAMKNPTYIKNIVGYIRVLCQKIHYPSSVSSYKLPIFTRLKQKLNAGYECFPAEGIGKDATRGYVVINGGNYYLTAVIGNHGGDTNYNTWIDRSYEKSKSIKYEVTFSNQIDAIVKYLDFLEEKKSSIGEDECKQQLQLIMPATIYLTDVIEKFASKEEKQDLLVKLKQLQGRVFDINILEMVEMVSRRKGA